MNTTEARQLAGEWHGGQTSALYSFSSTGVIHFDYWDYSREIKQCLRELGYDQRAEEGQLLALLLWFNEHCPRDEDEEEED